jgi:anti-sigma factor RsiW
MSAPRPITEEDLHAYVDAALSAARHAEVVEYLQAHPDVAARVDGFVAQRMALREALAPIAEEPVPAELNLAALIARHGRPAARYGWRAVAAAVVLFAAGGGAGWVARGPVKLTGIPALAQEAADSYEVYAPDQGRPVELAATDRALLVRWLSRRLNHPVVIPDLSASGYQFMGGRLVATPHGPAGLLMYDDTNGTRLVLLVHPMAPDMNATMTEHQEGHVGGYAWATEGVGYSLVGPATNKELHPIANEVRRQLRNGI